MPPRYGYPIDSKPEISDALKRRVEEASPTGSRCLIENTPEERSVQFCHVVPRDFAKYDSYMDNVEWFWNMRRGTLNLDSRYNIMCVGASLRELYVRHGWALLPDDTIVEKYFENIIRRGNSAYSIREAFPDIPNGIFNYRMIPLRPMESIGITRQQDTGNPTTASHVSYVYPYDSLPVIQSHIHPKYAILSLGRTFNKNYEFLNATDGTPYAKTSFHIYLLYLAWIHVFPKYVAKETPSYGYAGSSCDDGDSSDDAEELSNESSSQQTHLHRAPKGKRPRSDSLSLTDRLAKRSRHYGPELSPRALGEHEKAVGKHFWTEERLSKWSQHFDGRDPAVLLQ